jgi:hypothetical protein
MLRRTKNWVIAYGSTICREMQMAFSLIGEFKKQYGDDFGAFLTSAVVNEVFSFKPHKEPALQFLSENHDLIRSEARSLHSNAELCLLITEAVYSASYVTYLRLGGSAGYFRNPFLAYVRSMSSLVASPTPEKLRYGDTVHARCSHVLVFWCHVTDPETPLLGPLHAASPQSSDLRRHVWQGARVCLARRSPIWNDVSGSCTMLTL